jgi:hypothetical protein
MNFEALPPNPRKTASVRRLGRVDVTALKAAVLAMPESLWDAENQGKPNRFETLDATRHVIFRFIDNFLDWRQAHDRPLWADWKPLIEPVLKAATADYGYVRGTFPRIMLARMAPGGVIQPHRDTNPAAKWPHKIHVPISTNPDVTFMVAGTGYHFAEGEAVEVNNMAAHAVRNQGSTDRIHLIFEYYDLDQLEPDWIAPLREQASRQTNWRAASGQ